MRKILSGLLGMLSAFCIVSCSDFAIPESLTIQGNPGVHLPLGSPFGASGQSINDYIGHDKIQEMLNGNNQGVIPYDYADPDNPSIQTYLVRYEIAKLNLDLQKHIDSADDIEMPSITIPALPSIPESSFPVYITEKGSSFSFTEPSISDDPSFEISLGAIEQWMKNVHLRNAGIIIQGDVVLQKALELKIPQLGIDTYSTGKLEGENLVFTGDEYILFEQATNGPVKAESTKIKIYARLVSSPAGARNTYEMHLDFKWTQADLYPGENGEFTGTYEIAFGDLTEYLGNATFKEVPAQVFISGLREGTNGTMTLTVGDTNLIDKQSISPASLDSGSVNLTFDKETATAAGTIPTTSSINNKINLIDLFKTKTGKLGYEIKVDSALIKESEVNALITAELLIKIPLEFTVSGESVIIKKEDGTTSSYKELKLKPLESISDSGSSDLFGRSGKADDDLLQGVDEVTIGYYNYKNDIIDGLSLFTGKITNGNDGHIWELNGDSPPEGIITEFDKEAVTYPFNPQFKILVKDDATLKINRLTEGAKLDFSIVVDAKAAIDQTITF